MKITHKKYGELVIKVDPLLQKDVEAWFKELREQEIDIDEISAPEYAGGCVRAAAKLGWFDLDVDNSEPKKVLWVNRELQKYIADAFADDPN
jgi:hypothetical protein